METHITRQLGDAFDPETTCEYTGLSIWKWPILGNGASGMYYWREDGVIVRRRDLTKEELEWIHDNPEQLAKDNAGFLKWLKSTKQ